METTDKADMILPLYVNEYSTHFYSFESILAMDNKAEIEIITKDGDVDSVAKLFGNYKTFEVISKESYTHAINDTPYSICFIRGNLVSVEVPYSICFIRRNFITGKYCVFNSKMQCHDKAKFDTMEASVEFCKSLIFLQIYCSKNNINMQVI